MDRLLYVDSSALVKLVVREPGTDALLRLLEDWPFHVTSEISLVEVTRAARQTSSDPRVHERAAEILAAMPLVRLDRDILQHAALTSPMAISGCRALQLACALSLGPDLGAMIVYDEALSAAAAANGIEILAPTGLGSR